MASDSLIPPHGGYRKLKSFQSAEIVHDATVAFCDRFIDKHSRTHDQMVQAARSGKQNIAEGSQDSGTSRKIEFNLVGVARAVWRNSCSITRTFCVSVACRSGTRIIRTRRRSASWRGSPIGPMRPTGSISRRLPPKSPPTR